MFYLCIRYSIGPGGLRAPPVVNIIATVLCQLVGLLVAPSVGCSVGQLSTSFKVSIMHNAIFGTIAIVARSNVAILKPQC